MYARVLTAERYCELRECVNAYFVNTCLNLVTNWLNVTSIYKDFWLSKSRSWRDMLCPMWMNCLFMTRVANSAFSPLTTRQLPSTVHYACANCEKFSRVNIVSLVGKYAVNSILGRIQFVGEIFSRKYGMCHGIYMHDKTLSYHQSKLFTWSAVQQALEIASLLLLTRILHTFHSVMDSSHTPGHLKSFDRQ